MSVLSIQSLMKSSFPMRLEIIIIIFSCLLSTACGTGVEPFTGDPNMDPDKLASLSQQLPTKTVKLYIIDGTNSKKSDNTVMGILEDRYSGQHYYEAGPDWTCHDCGDIMLRVAADMCSSLRSRRITHIALAGYSRGAYLVRAALITAQRNCPDLNPEATLAWGGFIDPVPWAMAETALVNSWGGWKAGVPGINIMKEMNTPGLWNTLLSTCRMEAFAAPTLPTVIVNACHYELKGTNTRGPLMKDFLLGQLTNSAEGVSGMRFLSHSPYVSAPFAEWDEFRRIWGPLGEFVLVSGIARVSYRP